MSDFGQPPAGGAFGQGGGGFGQQPPSGSGGMAAPPGGAGPSDDARRLVQLPSVLMIIFGAVSVLASCMVALGSVWSFAVTEDGGQLVAGIWSIVMIGVNAFVAFAGYKMRNLQAYPLVLAGAVFCLLPFCTGYCCVVGIVPGAWSLFLLMKPEVKSAFT